MPTINDLPATVGDFGQDFNYSVWTPNTAVVLANVPWNSDYRDVVRFASQSALDDYIMNHAGPTLVLTGMTYARVGFPVRLNVPFNSAMRFNYMRVTNGAQPNGDTARSYYYFINDVRYVAPNTTEFDIQLDVWQTFHRDVTFGRAYVERGHIGIANENQMNDNGREYLTVPEGLDLGGEYVVEDSILGDILASNEDYGVLLVSTVSLENSGGTTQDPKLETAIPSLFENLPNGAAIYYCDSSSKFRGLMSALSGQPWVSQGIVSITVVPKIDLDEVEHETVNVPGSHIGLVVRLLNSTLPPIKHTYRTNWRNSLRFLSGRYHRLKKFMTYPYTVVEATTYTGNPLILKPESMGGSDLEFVCLQHLAPPAPRIAFYPYKYNAAQDSNPDTDVNGNIVNDKGEFLDMQTGIFNMPTFALVNSGYMAFLAQNSNSLAYQHSAADWSQQRALRGSELAYNQATANMGVTQDMARSGMHAAAQQTALANLTATHQAVTGILSNTAGSALGGPGALVGNAVSAAGNAASVSIANNQRTESLGIQTNLANQQMGIGVRQQGYMRDTNREYADFAAQGDYANAIAGVNAKVQDARMIQPTTSGQIGGDAFNLVAYRWGLDVKVKTLQAAARAAIGEFWLRYGYAVNRFAMMPSDCMAMQKFTYWKVREMNLSSSTCPELFRQTLRGIFEKGVTVWADPGDIGTLDVADNPPRTGVTL